MTTTTNAINGLRMAPPKSWQGALNAAASDASPSAAFDLNTATGAIATPTFASFRDAMNVAAKAKPAKSGEPESPEDLKLRKTAETLVNNLFMGTMLKQMRNSPFKDSTFSGGKAGEAYAGLFDQRLAANAGGGMSGKLVDSLVNKFKSARGNEARGLYLDPQRNAELERRIEVKRDTTLATA